MNIHEKFMRQALLEAQKAYKKDEVPVGCVIVKDGKIISRAYNKIKTLKNPTAHAEILVINKASRKIKNERLTDMDLYVTIEPCIMCAGAIVLARIKRVIFAAGDSKSGAFGSVFDIVKDKKLNHTPEIIKGLLEREASEIMKRFFMNKRRNK